MSRMEDLKVLCPPFWCGMEKRPGLFVCAGCSRPDVCEEQKQCVRNFEVPVTEPALGQLG